MFSGYSDSSARGGNSPSGNWIGTIPLRLCSGLVLLYLHTLHHAIAAWQFLWHQQPWDLPGTLTKAQLPYPNALAITASIIGISVTVSWLLGFLTRFFSFVFIPIVLGALLAANRLADYTSAEVAMLYLFIALTLLITGSGWFSVDALFQLKRGKKKRR